VNRTISVIVIDDSAFMRKSLSMMLEADPQIKVVATARDGREGIEKIRALRPDLVTLDIEMPGMDGLTALRIIMKEMPLPVLMVSSLTNDGAQATLDALDLGAVDFIPKELSYVSLNIVKIKEELIAKVKHIALSRSLSYRLQRIRAAAGADAAAPAVRPARVKSAPPPRTSRTDLQALVIGVSTGGPYALMRMIPQLPASFPLGIAIVQHMPPKFTQSMAERLNGMSHLQVKEAENGEPLGPGKVLIAPGGQHLVFAANGHGVIVHCTTEPSTTLYRPSADVMMLSAAATFRGPLLGLIMTGMGKDGLEGLRLIKRQGGVVIAQDEESCVVYGMPKAAVDDGLADYVVPLDDIPGTLENIARG
jgi:two-component system chemotaxis response regulator CheB